MLSNIWPEWQIEKQLGKGSYGTVYQAVRRDNNVESYAAIKIISIPSDKSEVDSLRSEGLDIDGTRTYFKGIVDDFVSEIQLMETLKGVQNIVSVEDYKVVEKKDCIGWDIYIRMELLMPFNTYICDKKLTEEEVIKLGCDICTALEICDKRNIIHRDIKPENIFVNDFGYFKLGDFGIARKLENMTGGLSQKGTFNYMAPEVTNSSEYDARVDTYSLGIVLYRLLNNNKLPFLVTDKQLLNPNERKQAVERRIRGESLPTPCNASPEMADLILRACAYDPNMRFASATEMKQALISVANGTYAIVDAGLDRTTSIRSAGVNYDATTAVRKATGTVGQNEQPVVNTFGDTTKKKMSKGKKAKIIAISVLSSVVSLAIALAIMFFSSAAYGVYRDMNSDDFDDALTEYRSKVKDSFIQEMLLDMLLKDRVSEVTDEYENGDIDYGIAIAELSALDEMRFDGAEEKIDEITVSNDSVNALAKADEYYENGDYENAISEYSKVPESNENYEETQNKLNQVYADYINSTVEIAKKHNLSKNYKQAVQVVNTAYAILPDSVDTTELDTVKEESLASYKTEVANEVTELTAGFKWFEAFDVINNAIVFDDNEYFQNLKVSTVDNCVNTTTSNVDKHLDQKKFNEAKKCVEIALEALPNNKDLLELQKKVNDSKPIELSSLTISDSKDYSLISGQSIIKDTVGNTYTTGNLFTLDYCNGYYSFEDESFATYYLGGKYSMLTLNLAVYNDGGNTSSCITIYGDDNKVLYTTGDVGRQFVPKELELDVSEFEWITFRISENDPREHIVWLIADPLLYK